MEGPKKPQKSPEELEKERLKKEQLKNEALKKYREGNLTVVNADELAKMEEKIAADETLNLKKGEKLGFFKRVGRKLLDPYYRQTAVNEARKKVEESGNIYANQAGASEGAHAATMGALVERFSSEFDEVVEKERGETKKTLDDNDHSVNIGKNEIMGLVKKYAAGEVTAEDFEKAKKEIFSRFDDKDISDAKFHADNLFEIAKNAKVAIEHGAKMDELDRDFKVIIGKAKAGVKTEAQYTALEKLEDKIAHSKVGRFVNPATMAVAMGVIGTIVGATKLGTKIGVSAATSFIGSAVVSGGLNAIDEGYKLKAERAQDATERARGKVFEEGAERREEMGQFNYQTEKASDILNKLGKEPKTPEELNQYLVTMATVEAYQKISNEKKIDLITYSKFDQVDQEKTALLIGLAQTKVGMRKAPGMTEFLNGVDFDTHMKNLVETKQKELLGGEKGITAQDKQFESFKHKKMAKVFAKTVAMGVAFGAVAQETVAAFSDHSHGIVDTIRGNEGHATSVKTPLQKLWEVMGGKEAMVPGSELHTVALPGGHEMGLPEGVTMQQTEHGYSFLQGDRVIAENLQLHVDPTTGVLDQASVAELGQHGIHNMPGSVILENAGHHTVPTSEYLQHHSQGTVQMAREGWMDNNTGVFDKNELKLWWGGENGTGIDANGDYVFDVSHMTKGGSFHDGLSVDALEKMKSGGLKVALSMSEGTQHEVFMYPVDEFGKIHIPAGDEAGRLMFSNVAGHADFHGRFAEVVETLGKDASGAEQVHVLSTYEGQGLDNIDVPAPGAYAFDHLEFPLGTETPYFIPVIGRNPMEEGGYKKPVQEAQPVKTPDKAPTPETPKEEQEEEDDETENTDVVAPVATPGQTDNDSLVAKGPEADRDVYQINDGLIETRNRLTPDTGVLRSRITILSQIPESMRTAAQKQELAYATTELAKIREEAAVAARNREFFAGNTSPSALYNDSLENMTDYYQNAVNEGTSNGTLGTIGFNGESEGNLDSRAPFDEFMTQQDRDREALARMPKTRDINLADFKTLLGAAQTPRDLLMNLSRYEKVGDVATKDLVGYLQKFFKGEADLSILPYLPDIREKAQAMKVQLDKEKTIRAQRTSSSIAA